MKEFYSCGKLLLTGEYLVMRGARGLALPTSRGQRMTVEKVEGYSKVKWNAIDVEGQSWFSAEIDPNTKTVISASSKEKGDRLLALLVACLALNESFAVVLSGKQVTTFLEFPNDWGLGSSSTLVNNLAQWAGVDPFDLHEKTSKGSGYDVVVAEVQKPLIFELIDEEPFHEEIDYSPSFKDKLWFVHLNQKADSAVSIADFASLEYHGLAETPAVTSLTEALLAAENLESFENVMTMHNVVMAKVLAMDSSQSRFPEYSGGITKYLGAWGGDFMLVTGEHHEVLNYFKAKGFNTILSFDEMIQTR